MANMQDVQKAARETLQHCKEVNKEASFYPSDDGNGRKGWSVCLIEYKDGYSSTGAPGDFEEWWGNGCLFLSTDGRIYEHRFRGKTVGEARSDSGTTTTNEVELADIRDLRYPRLLFNERRPAFQAVLEGLEDLRH